MRPTFAIGENLHINEQENNNGKEEKDGGDDGRKEGKEVIIKESIIVDGEIIPPKPEFPDNCCMSGCAHCVIDIYNEDLEEWEKKINQVKERLKKKGKTLPSNIFQKNGEDDDDNSNVNVGLKVFMELENSDDGDKIPELENNIKILKTTLNVDETDVIFSLVDKFNEISDDIHFNL
ncbi:18408_t:CDS:2, partial [Entrophospora sp. SA101]